MPVSCLDPNPSVSPCQMAKLRHARLRLRQKNRLTSPASPKNIMTSGWIHPSSRPDLFVMENRVGGTTRNSGRKYSQRIYSTYPFALRRPYTLCEEKRRCSSSLCRLSWPQQANEERPLSDPAYFRSPRQSEKCMHIHQNRLSSRLSPSPNRRRR